MISIVTPTLNSAKYLETLLTSVQNDPLIDKHIIVDSYSKDSTVEIAQSYNCKVLYCNPGNMYAAINHGISNTKSPYVSYINSDDVWIGYDHDLYDKADIIYSDIDFIDRNGRFLHSYRSSKCNNISKLFTRGLMPFPQAGTIFKLSTWKFLSGFSEKFRYSSDFDFFYRASVNNVPFHYNENLVGAMFRIHNEQLSQSYEKQMRQECRISLGQNFSRYRSFNELFYFKFRNIDNYIIRLLRNLSINRKNPFRTFG